LTSLRGIPRLSRAEPFGVLVDLVALEIRPHPTDGVEADRLTLGKLDGPTDPDRRHRSTARRKIRAPV